MGGGFKWFFSVYCFRQFAKKSMNYLVDSCFKRIYFTRGIRVVKHISSFISCVKRAVLHVSTFQDEGVCLLNKHIHWCRVDVLRRRSSSWCVLLGHFLLQNYFLRLQVSVFKLSSIWDSLTFSSYWAGIEDWIQRDFFEFSFSFFSLRLSFFQCK